MENGESKESEKGSAGTEGSGKGEKSEGQTEGRRGLSWAERSSAHDLGSVQPLQPNRGGGLPRRRKWAGETKKRRNGMYTRHGSTKRVEIPFAAIVVARKWRHKARGCELLIIEMDNHQIVRFQRDSKMSDPQQVWHRAR